MPKRPPQDCAVAGCPHPRTRGRHCPTHATRHDQLLKRLTPWRDYDSAEWKRRRAQHLATHPTCQCTGTFQIAGTTHQCKHTGPCVAPAVDVHHITPLRDIGHHDGPKEGLCKPCHGVRTHREVLTRKLARR